MKKTRKRILWVVIILIIIAGIWWEANKKPSLTGEVIKIGILEPLTGVRAEAGEYFKKGLDLALAEINNDSNKRYQLDLIFEDTQYNPAIAVTAFNKLTDLNEVKYVVGAFGSSSTLAVAPIAERKKIILITPGSQSAAVSQAGDYIFRTQINTAQEAPFMAKFIKSITNNKKIHILAINTDYSPSYMKYLIPTLEENDVTVGLVEKFGSKETDYRTQLLKLKSSNAEYILLLGTPNNMGQILKQAQELGIEATFFGSSTAEGKDLLEVGGNAVKNFYYAYPYNNDSNIKSMKTYREKYLAKYNEIPEMLSANIYDTIYMLHNCFEQVGDDVDKVKSCLYGIKEYKGASGVLLFDKNGDVVKPFLIKTVENGKFVPYQD